MFFNGIVYFESKLEHKFDIETCFNDFMINAAKTNIKFKLFCKQVNFSWNHENQWQAIAAVDFEVDDDVFGLNESPENAKRFIRDLLDVYLTNDKLTPTYIEDANVETDDGDNVEIPDFYFISQDEFYDEHDDIPSRVIWENFKRGEEFLNFVADSYKKSPNVWRRELQSLRQQNSSAAPVKIKKRNMKHIEPESKANDKRKIFILGEDEVI